MSYDSKLKGRPGFSPEAYGYNPPQGRPIISRPITKSIEKLRYTYTI